MERVEGDWCVMELRRGLVARALIYDGHRQVLAGCVHLLSQECYRDPHSQQLEKRDSGLEKPPDWTWP